MSETIKIIGNTTATPVPRSNWEQTDENKADFILNKPDALKNPEQLSFVVGSTSKNYDGSEQIKVKAGSNVTLATKTESEVAVVEISATNAITGVKGNAEITYRTGNVNITAADIGLGNVNNTSDANKPVSTAQKDAIDEVLAEAKKYADDKDALLLNNSSTAVDSIMELATAMATNDTVVKALEQAIGNKAAKATTLAGYGITDAYTKGQTNTAIDTAMAQFVECTEAEINSLFA